MDSKQYLHIFDVKNIDRFINVLENTQMEIINIHKMIIIKYHHKN